MGIKVDIDAKGRCKALLLLEEWDDATKADQEKLAVPGTAILYKTEKVEIKGGKTVADICKTMKAWKKEGFSVAGKVCVRPKEEEREHTFA